MKTLILFITLFIADTSRYEQAMLKNIEAISNAETVEQLQEIANTFDRIATKETDKWEPQYYSAYCHVLMAIEEEEIPKKDLFLDVAIEKINKAYTIAPEESEVAAMEGFVHMIRVTIDPVTRGQIFAGKSMEAYKKALSLNPDNPRALYLMAQMEMGTARFFGSDTAPACEKLKTSLEKFDAYNPENIIAPRWGRAIAERTYESCR